MEGFVDRSEEFKASTLRDQHSSLVISAVPRSWGSFQDGEAGGPFCVEFRSSLFVWVSSKLLQVPPKADH